MKIYPNIHFLEEANHQRGVVGYHERLPNATKAHLLLLEPPS
jgi:hypothetical protein